jgi:RimJ/RimL family protein N-acetyltransferase
VQLLNPSRYRNLQHLVTGAPHDLAVAAIMAGEAAGRVFVDDPAEPGVALVSPHWGRLYLLGKGDLSAAVAIRKLLHEVIRPGASAAGARMFTLAYAPDWESFVPSTVEGMRAVKADRQYYRWAGGKVPNALLPDGFALLAADAELLAVGHFGNLQLLRDEMVSERASIEDFLVRSFGVVAVHQDQLAGWCLSEYNTGARCEVGIATLEPFQRRGLAAVIGRAFLAAACTRGVGEVGWHCWKQNVPSAATARKIGLEHVADYAVYFGWYNDADVPG